MAFAKTLNESCQPALAEDARVLIVGKAPPAAVLEHWPQATIQLADREFSQRYDLAVLIHPSDNKQKQSFSQQLAAARDQWAKQVLALVPLATNNASVEQEYFALGFSHRPLPEVLSSQYCAYGFSIHHYKSTPDWLNSKYWANPEQWQKN